MNERVEELIGRTVHGPDGKVGKVDHVFRDKQTREPTWVSVSTGGLRGRSRLVPASALRSDGEDLRTSLATSAIQDAPEVGDRELSTSDEDQLRRHYGPAREGGGEDRGERSGVNASPAPSQAPAAAPQDDDRRSGAREEFGGINWGAAFFGWLVAIGVGVLLTALFSAAGAAVGTSVSAGQATKQAGTIGIVGAVILLIVWAIAYYAGGYVAGRMSRFDGGRQGVSVWVMGLIIAIVVAIAGAMFGSQFNVLASLKLPSIPGGSSLTGGALITLVVILFATLLAAFLGGKGGQRYHRKIDRLAYER